MRRALVRKFDQFGEDLSIQSTRFAYRLMNLCIKAEEVALLPVEVLVEDEWQKLEECASIAKKDEYSFMVVPKFDEDLPAIELGVMQEHPEFKQSIESFKIDSIDDAGELVKKDVRYLLLKMPPVNNDRYKVLKDSTKMLYDECKSEMEAVIMKYDAEFKVLVLAEPDEDDRKRLDKAIERTKDQWNGHRDKLYEEKMQEIEDAHNNWMADRVEERLDDVEEKEAHDEEVGLSMRFNPEDF